MDPPRAIPDAPAEEAGRPPEPRAIALLLVICGLYLAVVVGLASAGRFVFVFKTAVVPILFIAALAVRRSTAFLKDWSVFLGTVILFDCLRGLVYALITHYDLPIYALYVVRADEALLGGRTFPDLLQRTFFNPPVIGWFAKAMVVIHGSHFLFFLLFGLAVWLLRRDEFWRFRRAITLLLGMGITFYLIVPTVPPWMASSLLHLIPPIRHISAEIYNLAVPTLQTTFDNNPIGAMPSLHTAFPTLLTFIAIHHFGARAAPLELYTLAMYFSIGYLGEHYLVDIIAGAALAAFVYAACYRWGPLSRRRVPTGLTSTLRFQMLVALLLVVASEGIGQFTTSIRRPREWSRTFIEHELVGRSDRVHFFLAKLAIDQEDGKTALTELDLATKELKDPRDVRYAEWLIGQVRHVMGLPPIGGGAAPTPKEEAPPEPSVPAAAPD